MYQSIICYQQTHDIENYYNKLLDEGSLWIISENDYTNNLISFNPLSLIKKYQEQGFILKNIIILYNPKTSYYLNNRYKYVFWFVKQHSFYFNKDNIREKHKWAHLDWGKRSHKYHPKGKDPGNFWIKVLDDGKGQTTGHIALTDSEAIQRMILCTTKEEDSVYINNKVTLEDINRDITYEDMNTHNKINHNIIHQQPTQSQKIEKSPKYDIHKYSSENMKETPTNSVQTIITSPPYWDLKNYNNHSNQIGHKESYDTYHDRMNAVWKECYRVLKNSGSMFINVNTLTRNKELIPIQQDIIEHMQNIGFILKGVIIWARPYGIPNRTSLSDKFEYIMWFVKDENQYNIFRPSFHEDFKVDNLEGLGNVWWMYRKHGNISKKLPHPAIYPNDLVSRCMTLTSQEGDYILDPFLGSGTTLIESQKQNRHSIGFEINDDYEDIINHRLNEEI